MTHRSRTIAPITTLAAALLLGGATTCGRNAARLTGTPADSIVLGDSAYRACGSMSGAERQTCYEGFLIPLVTARDVRTAMGTLNRIGERDSDVKNDGHVYAHGIGIEAGKRGGSVTQSFGQCTEIFQSGCYHGVIQAYFQNVDSVNNASANALCVDYTSPTADRWLRFQCVHGMGHGLTMLYQHDLPRALVGCDLLSDGWDRESCYGGAFMENIVNATVPHHPAAALATNGAGAAGGSGGGAAGGSSDHSHHGAVAAAPPFKALDENDPQYPCSIMATRYLNACYQMQTSVMLHFNRGDIGGAARSCLAAPEAMRTVCHQSLGRDVASYSRQDHQEALRMCALADDRYEPWCHVGMVKNLIDLTAKAEDGIAYCRVVPGEANKLKCYEAVGEQIATLRNTESGRTELCGRVDSEGRAACLYGAKVTVERPRGLPS